MKKERKKTESLETVYIHARVFRERGITLIALVVTIVVLLILAGISISMVLGSDGIIAKTKESRAETRIAQIDEQVNLAIGDAYTEGLGSITDSGLKSALNNHLGEGTYDISGDETTGWQVTVKETGKTYNITANGKTDSSGGTLNWDKILEEANKNPESFKHPEQSETNNDIGIGTDGLPVNMDLWNASIINKNEITLGNLLGCSVTRGYVGEIKDGKIQGKIPAYIKKAGYEEFYKVTSLNCTFFKYENLEIAPEIPSDVTKMSDTFGSCTNLKTVPKIPSGVTNMVGTFGRCTRIETAPEIPSGVTNMFGTFSECTNLATAPEIPSGVTNMAFTFSGCTRIENAPEIPSGVTNMYGTFRECTNLATAPEIPSGVTDMGTTFYLCKNLTGTVVINATTLNDMSYTFEGTVKPIVLKGTSPYLAQIAATAKNGNVTVQTTSE